MVGEQVVVTAREATKAAVGPLLGQDPAERTVGEGAVMIAHRRRDVADLNGRAHSLMRAAGRLGEADVQGVSAGDRVAIADTRKGTEFDSVIHIPALASVALEPGEEVSVEIDWARRYALMRLHTALHVMSCVVVAPVTGGNISPDNVYLMITGKLEHAQTSSAWVKAFESAGAWLPG